MIFTRCPCCSQRAYLNCCGRYIDRPMHAPTPEALMRSRYTAYTQANIAYIMATQCDLAALGFDPIDAEQWAKRVTWKKLRIKKAWLDDQDDCRGFVEFFAYYQENQHTKELHETSEFRFKQKQWFYVAGSKNNPKTN